MMRVLIVDDRPENLYLLRALLQGHGCHVTDARHGAEALVKARQAPPDLVLSDLLMPVMDGYTLLRQWKADARLRSVPFVVYTATYTEPQDEKLALDLGADAFIVKPAEPNALVERLRDVCARAERGDLAVRPPPAEPAEAVVLKEYSEVLVHKLDAKRLELEQTSRDLTERERQLATLVSNLPGVAYRCRNDATYTTEFVSDGIERLTGFPAEDFRQHRREFGHLLHPEDRDRIRAEIQAATQKRQSWELTYRIHAAGGAERWLWERGQAVMDADGQVQALEGFITDITEHRLAEVRIQQLNRLYAMLSDTNQAIVHERAPQAMLTAACRIAVEKGGFRMAWIGSSPSAGEPLKLAAHAGATPDTMAVLNRIFSDPHSGCAFTRRALDTGRHAVCNDIARDPLAEAWRAAALERDYRAMVALPVTIAGKLAGTFNLYAGTEQFFDDEELRLLDELAADIGFAWEVGQRDIERHAAEERLARQRTALIELTSHHEIEGRDLPAALRLVTETGARTLNVARASVWRFNRERSAIECIDLFEAATQDHSSGGVLTAATHPAYFRALVEEKVLAADDAVHDAHTSEFVDDYLRPLGIQSMLDVPIRVGGQLDSVLCHEHVGQARSWTSDEKTFAVALANLVSLALEGWQRHQAVLALHESDARFREIAETIQEVFWVTDPAKTGMLYVSPAYERIWGRSCASLYASPRTWAEALHPDDRERVRVAVETQQASGTYDETYRIQRPDGTVRWIRDLAYPVRDESGEVVRVAGVARDVTERRQLEEQLRQSQKMEAIGQLAGGVAHDFNNILAVILMQSEVTGMADDVSEQVRDGLQEIRAAAERAARLTRQLLLFSRKQVMQSRDLDLNDVVASLATMLQRIIGEDVRLQIDLHPRPLMARADAGMLDQLLMNLVVNARDAMPDGGRLVITTAETEVTAADAALMPGAATGRHVCLRVTDTGSGIAADDLARIFEPFFTTKAPGKGTGLGLATVFGIVKQHNGRITVESAVGQGTTFRVFLPAVESAAVAVTEIQQAPRGGTETILLVEDDAVVRALTRHLLERAGYRILEAADGPAALTIGVEHRDDIALLLTDVVMPKGMSGRKLAARLQADNPRLRVVFTSGYSADLAGRELSLEPGQHFIQKPATPQDLLDTVRRCLDHPAGALGT